MINDLVEHFERELLSARTMGYDEDRINRMELYVKVVKIIIEKYPNADRTLLYNIIDRFRDFSATYVFFPLTLREGEFRYERPGISVNRRNNDVVWDNEGMYYKAGFRAKIDKAYNSFTGEEDKLDDKSLYTNPNDKEEEGFTRIYIKFGKYITNHYFTKCYLRDRLIEKHKFNPKEPLNLNLYAMTFGNKFILVVDSAQFKFRALRSFYDLHYKTDEDENLKKFGITDKIPLDAVRSKERFAF